MARSGIPVGAAHAYEVGMRSLESQSRRVDAIDTKAAVVLAVDGVLAGLLFGKKEDFTGTPRAFVTILILLLLSSFLSALRAFWTRKYVTAPTFKAVMAWMIRDEEWLKWRFLGNIQQAEAENSAKLQRKAIWLSLSMAFLFVDVVFSGGYLLWTLWR